MNRLRASSHSRDDPLPVDTEFSSYIDSIMQNNKTGEPKDLECTHIAYKKEVMFKIAMILLLKSLDNNTLKYKPEILSTKQEMIDFVWEQPEHVFKKFEFVLYLMDRIPNPNEEISEKMRLALRIANLSYPKTSKDTKDTLLDWIIKVYFEESIGSKISAFSLANTVVFRASEPTFECNSIQLSALIVIVSVFNDFSVEEFDEYRKNNGVTGAISDYLQKILPGTKIISLLYNLINKVNIDVSSLNLDKTQRYPISDIYDGSILDILRCKNLHSTVIEHISTSIWHFWDSIEFHSRSIKNNFENLKYYFTKCFDKGAAPYRMWYSAFRQCNFILNELPDFSIIMGPYKKEYFQNEDIYARLFYFKSFPAQISVLAESLCAFSGEIPDCKPIRDELQKSRQYRELELESMMKKTYKHDSIKTYEGYFHPRNFNILFQHAASNQRLAKPGDGTSALNHIRRYMNDGIAPHNCFITVHDKPDNSTTSSEKSDHMGIAYRANPKASKRKLAGVTTPNVATIEDSAFENTTPAEIDVKQEDNEYDSEITIPNSKRKNNKLDGSIFQQNLQINSQTINYFSSGSSGAGTSMDPIEIDYSNAPLEPQAALPAVQNNPQVNSTFEKYFNMPPLPVVTATPSDLYPEQFAHNISYAEKDKQRLEASKHVNFYERTNIRIGRRHIDGRLLIIRDVVADVSTGKETNKFAYIPIPDKGIVGHVTACNVVGYHHRIITGRQQCVDAFRRNLSLTFTNSGYRFALTDEMVDEWHKWAAEDDSDAAGSHLQGLYTFKQSVYSTTIAQARNNNFILNQAVGLRSPSSLDTNL